MVGQVVLADDDDLTLQEPLLVVDEPAHDHEDDDDDGSRFRRLIEQTPPDFMTRMRHRFLSRNPSTEILDNAGTIEADEARWSFISNPSMTNVSLAFLYISQIFLIWISLATPQWFELRIRLPFHADLSIETFDLAKLMYQMYFAEIGPPTIFLWVFSLVIPSLFTIFAPSFVLSSHSAAATTGRVLLESLQHAPFAAIYIMNLLAAFHDFGSSDIQLHAHAKPPITAFAMGTICSMLYVTIIRFENGIPKLEENDEIGDSSGDEDDDSVPMRILEDVPPSLPGEETPAPPKIAFWKKFMALQLGLLSLFLWVPSFFLPYCIVTVDSGWLRVLEREIHLGQVVVSLPTSLMLVPVLLGPLAATIAAFASWVLDARYKVHLYALRPWIGSVNLALTIWGVLHLVPRVLVVPALSLHARAGAALYISLAQAVCTELFVIGTVAWIP